MKKHLLTALLIVLAMTFTACGAKEETEVDTTEISSEEDGTNIEEDEISSTAKEETKETDDGFNLVVTKNNKTEDVAEADQEVEEQVDAEQLAAEQAALEQAEADKLAAEQAAAAQAEADKLAAEQAAQAAAQAEADKLAAEQAAAAQAEADKLAAEQAAQAAAEQAAAEQAAAQAAADAAAKAEAEQAAAAAQPAACTHTNRTHYVTTGTCTTRGEEYDVCNDCGWRSNGIDGAYGNHSWAYSRTVEAACRSCGYTYDKCTICGTERKSGTIHPLNCVDDDKNMICDRCGENI